jgi:hypothetical protein
MNKELEGMEISYYSYEDETDIFTGVFGHSISPDTSINTDEITKDGKVILILEGKESETRLEPKKQFDKP